MFSRLIVTLAAEAEARLGVEDRLEAEDRLVVDRLEAAAGLVVDLEVVDLVEEEMADQAEQPRPSRSYPPPPSSPGCSSPQPPPPQSQSVP